MVSAHWWKGIHGVFQPRMRANEHEFSAFGDTECRRHSYHYPKEKRHAERSRSVSFVTITPRTRVTPRRRSLVKFVTVFIDADFSLRSK